MKMGEEVMAALGMGFDLTSDFRIRFAKGGEMGMKRRLVKLDESLTRDVVVPGGSVIHGVPMDVVCDKGERTRFRSGVLEFNRMSELVNTKSSIQSKIPSGYFNALFDLSGSWLDDAMDTKHLAFDGYFISLYNLRLTASPLILRDEVKKAVPSKWDPASLTSFIKTYGTHIIVAASVGGQDVVCVRQKHSSPISTNDLKMHLEDLGDFLFSDGRSPPVHRLSREGRRKVPDVFSKILQSNNLLLSIQMESSSKDGLTIICSKRGGDVYSKSHSEWLNQVSKAPDAIFFKFVPITSLLTGIQGSGYLSHAINLYLRYKPATVDLQYFLEFQVPRQWAPMFNELALGPQRRKSSFPTLQFSFWSPKLLVNTTQVVSCENPVTGLRLFLEGQKNNQLAIHIQHLSNLPSMIGRSLKKIPSSERFPSQWRESDGSNPGFLEPIHWNSYGHVCTAFVEADSSWNDKVSNGVFVVTGAKLFIKGKWTKKTLHLGLQFSHIPNCTIQKSDWRCAPSATEHKSSILSNISTTFTRATPQPKQEAVHMNSGVYPEGPPVPVQSKRLLKYVDVGEVVRGQHDVPSHWLVTAARLVKEGGKITVEAQFSLLNYSVEDA